jgi:hypothetical protein
VSLADPHSHLKAADFDLIWPSNQCVGLRVASRKLQGTYNCRAGYYLICLLFRRAMRCRRHHAHLTALRISPALAAASGPVRCLSPPHECANPGTHYRSTCSDAAPNKLAWSPHPDREIRQHALRYPTPRCAAPRSRWPLCSVRLGRVEARALVDSGAGGCAA